MSCGNSFPCYQVRALWDGHFDFGRDRDRMNLKTAVSARDWSGSDFLGIVSGFHGIFWDYKILVFSFDFVGFIYYDV
jgi:hypothetical protein